MKRAENSESLQNRLTFAKDFEPIKAKVLSVECG